jgi:UDP-N-acetylglucosamine diphosphorylase / glucose-1-phosphate thymidylyltransferase / UDP-N-acetylgalactosamine diphosphorylase / glucosamine-1-phosphate N-acetyltransferase / galactosamine-1-phosphate N-acetyltransferase
MQVLIPMAGAGSRFSNSGITVPKPLIEVNGCTLIEHSIKSFDVDAQFVFVTRKFDNPEHNSELSQLLKKLRPESVEIQIDYLTNGASETCLAAKNVINSHKHSLVIYNCDQIIRWKAQEFTDWVKSKDPAGALVLYQSRDPKNSFAEIQDGRVTRVVEKQPISNHALIGFHYWCSGLEFMCAAEKLVNQFRSSGQPECYVSETYNYIIQAGATVLPYHIANNRYIPLGTPEDVAKYLGKIKEFYTPRAKTIFCDIDGTVLKHAHTISDALTRPPLVLDRVIEKFNQWDSQGHKIILVTARKESTRAVTEAQLTALGLAWDQLIMGAGGGARYVINDKLSGDDPDRAVGINVETDQGFATVDWEHYGL